MSRLTVTRAAALAALLSAWIALGCADARASEPLVVIAGQANDPVVTRLAYELRSLGFAVEVDTPAAVGDPAAPAARTALCEVDPSGSIEVWVSDAPSGRASRVETVPVDPPREDHAGIAVTRATEILRARLLPAPPPTTELAPSVVAALPASPVEEMRVPPRPTSPETPTPTAPSTDRSRVAFALGPAALLAGGGVPPALDLEVGLRVAPITALGLRASLALPIVSPTVRSGGDSASIAPWFGGVEGAWIPTKPASPWSVSLGAGAVAVWIRARGTAASPDVSAEANAVGVWPFAVARGARALWSRHARVALGARIGALLPGVGVRLADRQVATWGLPLAAVDLALEIDAP